LIENREPPAKTGIGYAQIQTIGYTRDVKTEAAGQQPAAQRRLAPRGRLELAAPANQRSSQRKILCHETIERDG